MTELAKQQKLKSKSDNLFSKIKRSIYAPFFVFSFAFLDNIVYNIRLKGCERVRRIKDTVISFEPILENKEVKVSKVWKFIYDWLDSLVFALLAIMIVFTFLFRVVGVVGSSMNPTLNDGDWLAVKAITTSVKQGDIVIITQPNALNEPLVKRVIAVAGDKVDINFVDHTVKINGTIISEPYIAEETERQFDVAFPLTVPEGCVFVMGDNRNNSIDSRSNIVGFIHEGYILGTAEFGLFPFGNLNLE